MLVSGPHPKELAMTILVLKLPDVKGETEDRPRKCPAWGYDILRDSAFKRDSAISERVLIPKNDLVPPPKTSTKPFWEILRLQTIQKFA